MAITVLAAVTVTCSGDDDGSTTEALPASLPVARTEVAGATWRGGLVVVGGLTANGGASALAHVYDAEANRWRALPPLPVPRHHAALGAIGDRLYSVGGYTNGAGQTWRPLADVSSLGPGEETWRDEPLLAAGPRGALAVAVAGRLLVAAGGEAGGQALDRVELYDPALRSWRSGPPLSRAREHLAAATGADGRVYVIAGRTNAEGNFGVVESWSPGVDAAWRGEPSLQDTRGGIGAAAVEGSLCVAGGEEAAGTIASVECFADGRWREVARLRRPRHGLAVMALDGRLHVVAGGEQPGLFVSGAHEIVDVRR